MLRTSAPLIGALYRQTDLAHLLIVGRRRTAALVDVRERRIRDLALVYIRL